MGPSTRIIRAGLLVAAAVVLAAAAAQLRDKRQVAELTVENIHAAARCPGSGYAGGGHRTAELG